MAFISEIHYLNSVANSTGTAEFAEVTLSPAEFANASDFVLATYQTDGTVRTEVNLGTLTPTLDPDTGYYVYEIVTPITAPNHTGGTNEAEAVALVDIGPSGDGVISFYDIAGGTTAITAVEGPATGATSATIPQAASGTQSIQFDIYGNRIDGALDQGSSVVCFNRGTLIETPGGQVPVEALRPGDLVKTLAGGFQPLCMVHSRRLGGHALRADPGLRPVRISRGALGDGLPRRDLWVSQQHRMLLNRPWFPVMFDVGEALVRAKSLPLALPGVTIDARITQVTYYHLVFEQHEIVYAEGAPTESFHPGRMALSSLSSDGLAEVYRLFPSLRVGDARPEAPYRTLDAWEFAAAA